MRIDPAEVCAIRGITHGGCTVSGDFSKPLNVFGNGVITCVQSIELDLQHTVSIGSSALFDHLTIVGQAYRYIATRHSITVSVGKHLHNLQPVNIDVRSRIAIIGLEPCTELCSADGCLNIATGKSGVFFGIITEISSIN